MVDIYYRSVQNKTKNNQKKLITEQEEKELKRFSHHFLEQYMVRQLAQVQQAL
jgi:hypothetical protein